MELNGLSLGLKEMCSLAKTHMQSWMAFICLVLLWSSSTSKDWHFGLGSFDFPPWISLCDLLVLFSLFFLGFRVRNLDRRFEELGGLPPKFRKGFSCGCHGGNEEAIIDKVQRRRNFIGRNGLSGSLDEFEEMEMDQEEEEEKQEMGFEEEEEDDVMKLRENVAKERKLRVMAEMELVKERRAASSAADEAMAKIVMLQNEKGLIEREARQYREMAEQKQLYDHEVIEYLQWIILKLESER